MAAILILGLLWPVAVSSLTICSFGAVNPNLVTVQKDWLVRIGTFVLWGHIRCAACRRELLFVGIWGGETNDWCSLCGLMEKASPLDGSCSLLERFSTPTVMSPREPFYFKELVYWVFSCIKRESCCLKKMYTQQQLWWLLARQCLTAANSATKLKVCNLSTNTELADSQSANADVCNSSVY